MNYSVFIQGADTYLHIATEAVEVLQIKPEDPSDHLYSRGLAPWCTTRPTFGSETNQNFWGCGQTVTKPIVYLFNQSSVTALSTGVSKYHDISDFVDEDGLSLAILMPKGVKPGIDWSATSFAVSTKCYPFRNSSCEISRMPTVEDTRFTFNCSSTEPELKTSGYLYAYSQQIQYYNWHRYIEEPPAFADALPLLHYTLSHLDDWARIAKNLTDDEGEHVFSNPWQMLSVSFLESSDTILSDDDRYLFSQTGIWAMCNNTGSYRSH
jgi:hypothetical protein